jgi:hypothetical protein
MAGANLPAKKYKKTAPTVLRLSFEGSGGTTRYIDIARALSAINRKFYRQGVYYYVNSVELYNNEDAFVDLHTLPDNWTTKNAWNRGFQMFQKMNAMVDTPRPKYHDFKVLMSSLQTEANTMDPEMFNINSQFTSIAPDEWVYSKFVSAEDNNNGSNSADNFTVHMLGPHIAGATPEHYDSVGLIQSYAFSRPYPPQNGEPALSTGVSDDPLLNLFDFSSEDQIDDIITNLNADNDETPYDRDYYVGQSLSHMQHVARLATSVTTGRVAKASGFCAPFGLICVDPQDTATAYRVVINLAAGTYHGVYAERA